MFISKVMSQLQLILYDILEEFKVLPKSTVELMKDYIEMTDFPLSHTYYRGKRLLNKEIEKEMVKILAKVHNFTYLQARRKINKAMFTSAVYITYVNQIRFNDETPSQMKEDLERRSKDSVLSDFYKKSLETFDRDMEIVRTYFERNPGTGG